MLHTKFQGNQPSGSGEEDFQGFYNIWAWQPSWSCDLTKYTNFLSPLPGSCLCNLNEIGLVVSEKESFENVDDGQWTDDGR